MENLKPCPFCGGEAEINQIGNEHTKSRGFEVKCTAWGCATKKRAMVIRHTLDDARVFAITAWNTRPSPARDEGAGTMEVTRAAEDAACAAYRALDMGQRWTLEPAMRAAIKAALPHLAAPVFAPGMDREAVARIIDRDAYELAENQISNRAIRCDIALAKADQIIALQRGAAPADGSQVEPSTTGAGRHIPLEPNPFIQWNGGENPLNDIWIEFMQQNGYVSRDRAGDVDWHANGLHSIIAYRIIPTDDQGGGGT